MSDRVNILVVDDLATQRLTIEAALAELGERVVSVGSGREALKFLLDQDAAVILLDVNMPEMDGFETAMLIRQRPRTATTPIIFLTADTDEMQAARGYALGAVDYLFCPFLPDVLRTKVKVFVSLSRARERIREEAEQRIALLREQAARAAAEEQGRRLGLLVEAGGVLTRSLDGSPFEGELLRLLVPALADAAGVVFHDAGPPDGRSTWVADGNGIPAPQPTLPVEQILSAPIAQVLATGSEEILHDAAGRVRAAVVPLVLRGRTYGALGVAFVDSERRLDPADLELLHLIASRTAIALDNRRLYRELQERDRRKDEFLAMLSHELRNPLGAITTAVRLLELTGGDADDRSTRARQVIARQSFHLARMVDDLLDVSRVTAGRIALMRETVDLREVVDRAVDGMIASGRFDHHELTVHGDPVLVEADAARLEQVITNLLVNAVKYTDAGGRITVRVEATERTASVRVTDTGIGISPELLPNLFDVFVQGRQTLARAEGGLGIGLTLVKKLVELQGGTVDVESGGVGRGSTFTVCLPRAAAAAPRAPARLTQPTVVGLEVLVVEDNEDARTMLRTYLELRGHRVVEAASGPEAVEAAARSRPHLGLVDLGLPGFDGLEVAQRLRADPATRAMVLVAITGYGQAEDRRRSASSGFDGHLVKPVTPERLGEVLEMAARQVASRSAVQSTTGRA